MSDPPYTPSALGWLRETSTLDVKTLKRAYWERLEPEPCGDGEVIVRNASYAEPDEHCHVVLVDPTGSIVSSCDCPQYTYRHRVCKHMVAVALALDGDEMDVSDVTRSRSAEA